MSQSTWWSVFACVYVCVRVCQRWLQLLCFMTNTNETNIKPIFSITELFLCWQKQFIFSLSSEQIVLRQNRPQILFSESKYFQNTCLHPITEMKSLYTHFLDRNKLGSLRNSPSAVVYYCHLPRTVILSNTFNMSNINLMASFNIWCSF